MGSVLTLTAFRVSSVRFEYDLSKSARFDWSEMGFPAKKANIEVINRNPYGLTVRCSHHLVLTKNNNEKKTMTMKTRSFVELFENDARLFGMMWTAIFAL